MDVGKVREVQQVVDGEQIVASKMQPDATRPLAGYVDGAVVGDERRVSELGISHPYPEIGMSIENRICAHPRALRHARLPRNLDAGSAVIIDEAMIGAFDPIAVEPPHGEGEAPMRAAILECDGRALFGSIDHRGLAEESTRRQRVAEIVGEAGSVPAIAQEHRIPPRRRPAFAHPQMRASSRKRAIMRRACSRPASA
jgi:hypothetical protein